MEYLESLKGKTRLLASLRGELSDVVAMVVPGFADAACIDCFQPGGATQRFAMFAHDQSILLSDRFSSTFQNDAGHCLKIVLSDGIAFCGTLQLARLWSARSFSEDERLDSKLLASRLSSRISIGVANSARPDCGEGEFSGESSQDEDPSDAHLHHICGLLTHEFRNPLSVFNTAVDLLENDSKVDGQLHDILKLQTDRMTRLVDDLLDMSRHINGKTRLQKEPTPLRSIIDAVLKPLSRLSPRSSNGWSPTFDRTRFGLAATGFG